MPHAFPFGSAGHSARTHLGNGYGLQMGRELRRIGAEWLAASMMQALRGGSICTRGGRGRCDYLSASGVIALDEGCVGLQPNILGSIKSRGL